MKCLEAALGFIARIRFKGIEIIFHSGRNAAAVKNYFYKS